MVRAKEYRKKAVWGLRKSHVLVSDVKSKEYVGYPGGRVQNKFEMWLRRGQERQQPEMSIR